MGNLYILIAIFLWSSLGIFIRYSAVEIHVLIFYSLVVSSALQGIMLSRRKYRAQIPSFKELRYPLLLGFLSLINTFSFYCAYKNTTIANSVLTHYIAPVIVAFLAPLMLKERITWKIIITISTASAGLLIMMNGYSLEAGHASGIMAGLLSGVTYAFIIIYARNYSQGFNPLVLTFFTNAVIVTALAPFIREMPFDCLWLFIVMGIVHSTIAPVFYYKGLQTVTAGRAAVLGYFEPVCAILLGMIALHETPGFNSVFGGALIIISGYYNIRKG